jgi:hypothetical protein
VPFARENTGIELVGNANTWWGSAAGLYERGAKPEVGSVLSFRATGHMRMGHVAVVSDVIDSRTIQVDHANWSRGRVTRDMVVMDVSPDNDWTAVRVGAGSGAYPTNGFIYDRPDRGTMVANVGVTPTQVAAHAMPDTQAEPEEVAEAPDDGASPTVAPSYSRYRAHQAWRPVAWHRHAVARPNVVHVTFHPIARWQTVHRHQG